MICCRCSTEKVESINDEQIADCDVLASVCTVIATFLFYTRIEQKQKRFKRPTWQALMTSPFVMQL